MDRSTKIRINGELRGTEAARDNFSDGRLNARLATIARRLAKQPSASLPSAFTSAELEAAYRFFSNVFVTPASILAPHVDATRLRAASRATIRVVHDTTELSYRHAGKRRGFGDGPQHFKAHVSLAVSCEGSRKPLGVAAVEAWVDGSYENQQDVWLQQIRASEAALDCKGRAIHITDREGDDYFLFHELLLAGHRFVVRSSFDRWTKSTEDGPKTKLHSAMAMIEHVAERDSTINPRARNSSEHRRRIYPAREARDAKLHVAATRLELVRPVSYVPSGKKGHLAHLPTTLAVNVVRVWEPEPPADEVAIEWLLFTTEPIGTADEVSAVVDHYRARWIIEEYFKALKTGCAFERRQLQDFDSLANALAVFAPLAYHVLLLRTVARVDPATPATDVASSDELEVLRVLGRRPIPPNPTARDIRLAIAALGGHIKYAPDPGWLTIARGYEKLEALVEGWQAGKLQRDSDQR